jgi:hypothetical protein
MRPKRPLDLLASAIEQVVRTCKACVAGVGRRAGLSMEASRLLLVSSGLCKSA